MTGHVAPEYPNDTLGLVDAVFVTGQRGKPAIAPQANAGEGIQHHVGRQLLVGVGGVGRGRSGGGINMRGADGERVHSPIVPPRAGVGLAQPAERPARSGLSPAQVSKGIDRLALPPSLFGAELEDRKVQVWSIGIGVADIF